MKLIKSVNLLLLTVGIAAASDTADAAGSTVSEAAKTKQRNGRRTTSMFPRRLDADDMSLSTPGATDPDVEETGDYKACPSPSPSPKYPFHLPGHEDEQCAPKGTACGSAAYYKILTLAELQVVTPGATGLFKEFLEATPEGCVMAPVHSFEEWQELLAEATLLDSSRTEPGTKKIKRGYWIGISKSFADSRDDNGGSGSRANWYNLDGTPADGVCPSSVWSSVFGEQPDNRDGVQWYASMDFVFSNGLLTDMASAGQRRCATCDAIYKCCTNAISFPSCDV